MAERRHIKTRSGAREGAGAGVESPRWCMIGRAREIFVTGCTLRRRSRWRTLSSTCGHSTSFPRGEADCCTISVMRIVMLTGW